MTCIAPLGVIDTVLPTYSWESTPWASCYELQVNDGLSIAEPTIHEWVSLAACGSQNGVCAYTPRTEVAAAYPASWWVRPWSQQKQDAPWSPRADFLPKPVGLNTFDDTPCAWVFVSDSPGQTRRVIDLNTARGNLFAFPMETWTVVDVSDLVPPEARAILLQAQLIFTTTSGEPLLAYKTRRHGSLIEPGDYHGIKYTMGKRTPIEMTVLLGPNRKFDFWWSDSANGITPGTTSGWAFNASMIAYAKPMVGI